MKNYNWNTKRSEELHARQETHQAEALEARVRGEGDFAVMPHTIALAVNNRCFLKCIHCDVGEENRKRNLKGFFYHRGTGDEKRMKEIPLDVLKHLVDDVAPFKPVIRPTFLEPLIRKDLFEFAAYVKKKGLLFNLQTNGVLLPQRYREVVNTGTDVLRVSLDGPSPIHDDIRGIPGSFDKVIDGLLKLIQYKKERNAAHPVLGISYVISGKNYNHILDFMKDMQKMGILEHVYVAFCFLRFVSQYEAENHNRHFKEFFQMTESSCVDTQKEEIDTNTLIKELEMLFEYFPKKYHHYYFNPSPLSKKDIHRWFATDEFLYPDVTCHVPWTHCQILYNGDVIVNGRCCSPVFGNIYKQNFREIWNSETARHFRKTLLLNKNFPVCNRCSRKFNVQMLS